MLYRSGDPDGLHGYQQRRRRPRSIGCRQPAAKDAFRALGAEITSELREARGTAFTAILARIAENAQKIALIRAAGNDPQSPAIELDDAVWSIDLIRHFASSTMISVDRHVADNEVRDVQSTPFGVRYVIDGPLFSPSLIALNVRSVWFISRGEVIPRFVTAHPLQRRRP